MRCTRINALLNTSRTGSRSARATCSGPVDGQRFDVVLFNPPYYRGRPRDPLDAAWRSTDVVERFAAGLHRHLTSTGEALVVLSTDGDRAGFLETFRYHQLRPEVVVEHDLINEVLSIYRLRAVGA